MKLRAIGMYRSVQVCACLFVSEFSNCASSTCIIEHVSRLDPGYTLRFSDNHSIAAAFQLA